MSMHCYADHVVSGYLEREHDPKRDETCFGRDDAVVAFGPESACEIE